MKRVIVGLSGGVDSSVAAYLLKMQGYEVIGIYMQNWHDDSVIIDQNCPWVQDSNDALMVAEKLEIPFQTIDLSEDYRHKIVDYMFETYLKGQTPNPDILCNREIKFSSFLDIALKLEADYIATGHYCQKAIRQDKNKTIYSLLKGKDSHKDQSYFLCQLNQNQLAKTLFPIGNLYKNEVRKIAQSLELITAGKKDSQGLCFVGKVRLPIFLRQQLSPQEGKVIEISDESTLFTSLPAPKIKDSKIYLQKYIQPYTYKEQDGEVIGTHQGAYYFTIGQRKGLNIGGKTRPLFIIGIDVKNNILYVGKGEDHQGLYRYGLSIQDKNVHWVRPDLALENGQMQSYDISIRYRQKTRPAFLYRFESEIYIIFKKPQKAITSGQFAVWYTENELIGSGVID